ncbi:VOC family protein [Sphingomonas sp. PL-96]|uniref:VOC family protein n=1 Tax=Sphingomonas sp. PL-96 TaxID=2887201 RepID=UPI001E2BD497|nr:VOC family protein [Sphingomonas sp. PL-96]MCC2976540.1 VOC family protein [Sphingomonas sp. PL-96]
MTVEVALSERTVSSLIRGTIFVRDLARSCRFYAALGFTRIYYEGVLLDPSASTILGFADHGPLALRICKSDDGPNYGMIGLFKIDPALQPGTVPMASGPARIGEVALVFYVRSMASTLDALRAAGATWSPEPEMFRMPHRAQQEVCLRDPDGVLLNLVETDPGEQQLTGREGA